VLGPVGAQVTLEKVEAVHEERRALKCRMAVQKIPHGPGLGQRAAREREVRMEGAHVGRKPGGKDRIIDPLAELMQPRMPVADSRPEHLRLPACWEDTDTADREHKGDA